LPKYFRYLFSEYYNCPFGIFRLPSVDSELPRHENVKKLSNEKQFSIKARICIVNTVFRRRNVTLRCISNTVLQPRYWGREADSPEVCRLRVVLNERNTTKRNEKWRNETKRNKVSQNETKYVKQNIKDPKTINEGVKINEILSG
jgi:hypothetical protein